MHRTTLAFLVLFAASTAGCSEPPERFYPLAEGRAWTYAMTIVQGEGEAARRAESVSTVTNLPLETFAGMRVVPQRSEAFGQTQLRLIHGDSERVSEVGEQLAGQSAPVARTPPNDILRTPLQVGATWPAVWSSSQFGRRTLMPMTKRVAATDARVSVPGGEFRDCLLLTISGGGPIMTAEGERKLSVSGEEWFAPGEGLVKASFREEVLGLRENMVGVELTLSQRRP